MAGGGGASGEAFPLRGGVAGDEPDLVAERGQATFDELDRLDHDSGRLAHLAGGAPWGCRGSPRLAGPSSLSGCDQLEDSWPHRGVDDRFKPGERDGIGEHDPPKRRAVEGAVSAQETCTEGVDHRGQHVAAGRRDVAGDLIGIDDECAELAEPANDGRLAAANWAGDADADRPTDCGLAAVSRCHGARSSSESQASSADASAVFTSASSLETRRISTKFDCTAGRESSSSR